LHLPLGLLGFEKIKRYQFLSLPEEAPFVWLQVLDDPNLAFLTISPFEVLPEYQPSLTAEDVEFLGLRSPAEAGVYGIVTLRPLGRATINLKGPVIFNRRTWMGKQVIVTNASDYSLQHPLPVGDSHPAL
jgi:flagellar assembly factor FliW